jgi:insulysin
MVRELTKEDMLSFFNRYISPSSSERAKLSVHLTARVKTGETPLRDKDYADEASSVSISHKGQGLASKSHPIRINDCYAWRATRQVSDGVKPVRNLEEFAELERICNLSGL